MTYKKLIVDLLTRFADRLDDNVYIKKPNNTHNDYIPARRLIEDTDKGPVILL